MEYQIDYQDWLYVRVSVSRSFLGNHPVRTVKAYYRKSLLYHSGEVVCRGLKYENFDERNALNSAWCAVGRLFDDYAFVYEDFPNHMEYDFNHNLILPFPFSHFPVNSIFEVEKLLIDKKARVFVVMNNSSEGRVISFADHLLCFPVIDEFYRLSLSRGDRGVGGVNGLSNRIIGQRFRVLKYSKEQREYEVEEFYA